MIKWCYVFGRITVMVNILCTCIGQMTTEIKGVPRSQLQHITSSAVTKCACMHARVCVCAHYAYLLTTVSHE